MNRRRAVAALIAALTASSLHAGSQIVARKAAVTTISPYATQIGVETLKRGGNAIDAAVAVSFALAVAHPQAGNISGGGYLVYYEAKTKQVWTLDFREVAPRAAKADMYATKNGVSETARVGPLSAAVPGTLAGLAEAHSRFGSRPWKELIEPAVMLARSGMRVDQRLFDDLQEAREQRKIDRFPSTAALLFPNGRPLTPTSTFVQSELAATLARIAAAGARDFYEGDLAKKWIEAQRAAGGIIGYRDLREYKPVWRAPINIRVGKYDLYTVAPPSGGGLIIGEVLNILAGFDLAKSGFQTPLTVHLLAEAERRAWLDRSRYLADPAMARIPYRELLSAERGQQWRSSINATRATPTVTLAEPAINVAEGNHTTHFTIADANGNVISLTTTLSDNFGGGFVVPGCGFLLNDSMNEFTTMPGKPDRDGVLQGVVNAIEPGKRMTSSMSPTIVLDGSKPLLALGTRGGPAIPSIVLQVVLNVTLYGKPLYEAVAAPRYHQQAVPDAIVCERDRTPQNTLEALNGMGHPIDLREPIGDVQAIMFDGNRIVAVADPRNGGAAGGY
jgi:gamma-glutamyltranspeptidase / glutathione hydrolase